MTSDVSVEIPDASLELLAAAARQEAGVLKAQQALSRSCKTHSAADRFKSADP